MCEEFSVYIHSAAIHVGQGVRVVGIGGGGKRLATTIMWRSPYDSDIRGNNNNNNNY